MNSGRRKKDRFRILRKGNPNSASSELVGHDESPSILNRANAQPSSPRKNPKKQVPVNNSYEYSKSLKPQLSKGHIEKQPGADSMQEEERETNENMDKDDFSYSSLHNMWSQRDTQVLKINPPTATTFLQYSATLPSNSEADARMKNTTLHKTKSPQRKGNNDVPVLHSNSFTDSKPINCSYDDEINTILFKTNANDLTDYSDNDNSSSRDNSLDEDMFRAKSLPRPLQLRLDDSNSSMNDSVEEEKVSQVFKSKPQSILRNHRKRSDNVVSANNNKGVMEDPYANYDTMSTANSEVTVKADNTHQHANYQRLLKKASMREDIPTPRSDLLGRNRGKENIANQDLEDSGVSESDQQYEADSEIPDSAFEADSAIPDSAFEAAMDLMSSFSSSTSSSQHPPEKRSALYPGLTNKCHQFPEAMSDTGTDIFDGISEVPSSINSNFDFERTLKTFISSSSKDNQPTENIDDDTTYKNTESIQQNRHILRRPKNDTPSYCASHQAKDRSGEDQKTEQLTKKLHEEKPIPRKVTDFTNFGANHISPTSFEGTFFQSLTRLEVVGEEGSCGSEASGEFLLSQQENGRDSPTMKSKELFGTLSDSDRNFNALQESDKQLSLARDSMNPSITENGSSSFIDYDDDDTFKKEQNILIKNRRSQDDSSEILITMSWIQSMMRLYQKKIIETSEEGNVDIKNETYTHSSPRSVLDVFSTKRGNDSRRDSTKICISQCRMKSIDSIQLYHSEEGFGCRIDNPVLLVDNGMKNVEQLSSQRLQLRSYLDERSDSKYFRFRKKKINMLDKAIEVHEYALASIEAGNEDKAMESYERFFELHDKNLLSCDDKCLKVRIVGTLLFNLGNLHIIAGDQDLAVDFLSEALASLTEIGKEKGEYNEDICTILNEIGIAKFSCGKYEEALRHFAEILSLYQENEDTQVTVGTAKALNNIGCVYFALEEFKPGLEAFAESLEVLRSFLIEQFMTKARDPGQNGDTIEAALLYVARTIGNIAHVKHFQGIRHEAKLLLKETLSIHIALSGKSGKNARSVEAIISSLEVFEV